MSLLYCCISFNKQILCQNQNGFLKCIDFARSCISDLGPFPHDDEAVFTNNTCTVFVLVRDKIVYLAVAEREANKQKAKLFLRQVAENFYTDVALVARAKSSQENELQYDYGRTLAREMDGYSRIKVADKTEMLRNQVDEVSGIMKNNIDRIMERGERLEEIVDRAEELNDQTTVFRHTTRKVKRKMWWQNFRMKLILGGVVLLILAVIILIILWQLGVFSQKGGGHRPQPNPSTTVTEPPSVRITTMHISSTVNTSLSEDLLYRSAAS